MAYIFTRTLGKRYKYYLGKNGRWEGLIDNAKKHYEYIYLSTTLLQLRAKFPKEKIDYIDLDTEK